MRRRFAAILLAPAARSAASGTVCEVIGEMSPAEVCATGTGIGAVRALILWPEMVTLGGRCSRWPSWQWPLIIDGPIVLATLGFSRWRPTRPAAESGLFGVVPRIAALVGVGGNVLHAWLGTAQLASWTRAGGETWRQGGVAPCFSCHIAAGFLMPYRGRLFDEVEFARGVPPNLRPLTVA
jgi:hypothetical protein